MITIISEGRIPDEPTYEATCPKCNTVFTYQDVDLVAYNNGIVNCPLCKMDVKHNKTKLTQPPPPPTTFSSTCTSRKIIQTILAKIK